MSLLLSQSGSPPAPQVWVPAFRAVSPPTGATAVATPRGVLFAAVAPAPQLFVPQCPTGRTQDQDPVTALRRTAPWESVVQQPQLFVPRSPRVAKAEPDLSVGRAFFSPVINNPVASQAYVPAPPKPNPNVSVIPPTTSRYGFIGIDPQPPAPPSDDFIAGTPGGGEPRRTRHRLRIDGNVVNVTDDEEVLLLAIAASRFFQ